MHGTNDRLLFDGRVVPAALGPRLPAVERAELLDKVGFSTTWQSTCWISPQTAVYTLVLSLSQTQFNMQFLFLASSSLLLGGSGDASFEPLAFLTLPARTKQDA